MEQQCASIDQSFGVGWDSEQWQNYFDSILNELENSGSLRAIHSDTITQIVAKLITIDPTLLLKHESLRNHRLWLILRTYFTDLLFNHEQAQLVNDLSNLFHKVYCKRVSTNDLKLLFLHPPLIERVCEFFKEIETYSQKVHLITVIDQLIHAYQRIQMLLAESQANAGLKDLFDALIQCMNSTFFTTLLVQGREGICDTNGIQQLFFHTCVQFLYWQPYEGDPLRQGSLQTLCGALLEKLAPLMTHKFKSYDPLLYLYRLIALNSVYRDDPAESKHMISLYHHLNQYCMRALVDASDPLIQRTFVGTLCHLTYDMELLVQMKENLQLKTRLLEFTEVDDSELSFTAYRVLAMIMTEQDIKNLQHATKIVNTFHLYTISMIDDPLQSTAFASLLHSLKNLAQHDQIKIEILKQDTIPLLIRCVIEDNCRPFKIPQYALEILLAVSLVKESLKVLSQSEQFVEKLKLLKDSTNLMLERAAEHLLWQLECQSHSVQLSHQSNFQFDLMLSYSHSDKNLCFQLVDHLRKDGYKVWLDRDHMHGDTMAAMADAIENSEFVLICMSEAYKCSPYCQAEAQYAFERRRTLIPLVMKNKYKPDGWLGILVSGRIYVDFSKFEFNVAYNMVKNEIVKKRIPSIVDTAEKSSNKHRIIAAHSSPMQSTSVTESRTLPHCVDVWTPDDVRAFLIMNNFHALLPVFNDFNGQLLHQAYLMCQSGRETMFQSIRSEAAAVDHARIVTLGTYLRFLEELKKYIPIRTSQKSTDTVTTICTVM